MYYNVFRKGGKGMEFRTKEYWINLSKEFKEMAKDYLKNDEIELAHYYFEMATLYENQAERCKD